MDKKNLNKISKVKLNVNYVEFIGELVKGKLLELNKEKLRSMYISKVKVKSWKNINRVSERVKREKVRSNLNNVLKKMGLSYGEFVKVSDSMRDKIRDRGDSNYIVVE